MIKCPINDITCPYNHNGKCVMENAEQECDEFAEIYNGEIEVVVDGR